VGVKDFSGKDLLARLRRLDFSGPGSGNPPASAPATHPYAGLPDMAFWKRSVANRDVRDLRQLWSPKLALTRAQKVATFGSCFAQHFGRALGARGFNWLTTERAPYGLSPENARRYNYDVFSCRTANIYTVSLLRQWVGWASRKEREPDEAWEKDGRIYDPFRPTIEPGGFKSEQEMRESRDATIRAFRRAVEDAGLFVFTLGLTESWFHARHGYEYPLCPGTAGGEFDSARHEFRNQRFEFIKENLTEALQLMRGLNPDLKVLLTVSPVPLVATNSGNHVLVATTESKAILRAVAGEVAAGAAWIDYFPSYEIISSPPAKGAFFEPDMRQVTSQGVDFVMDTFFGCLESKYGLEPQKQPDPRPASRDVPSRDDLVCEEEMLDAFGEGK